MKHPSKPMTVSTPDIQALIEEARAKIEVAHTELIRILSVGEQTRMSIPANPSRDTDLIIVSALDAGRDLAAALSALSGETETEWEYGIGYEGDNGVEVKWFSLYDQAFTIREAAERDLQLYTDDANVKLVRRRKAGPWIEATK